MIPHETSDDAKSYTAAESEAMDVSALTRQIQDAEAHNRAQEAAVFAWDRDLETIRATWERDHKQYAGAKQRGEAAVARQRVALRDVLRCLAVAESDLAMLQSPPAELPEPALPRPEPSIIDTAPLREALLAIMERRQR